MAVKILQAARRHLDKHLSFPADMAALLLEWTGVRFSLLWGNDINNGIY